MAGGRPSKLTPESKEILFSAIRSGAPYEDSANLAGIAYSTLRNWILEGEKAQEKQLRIEALEADQAPKKRSRKGQLPTTSEQVLTEKEQEFLEFLEGLRACEGQAVVRWSTQVSRAAGEEWRAAAFMLERRRPNEFAKRPPVTEQRTDESLNAELAKLARAVADRIVANESRD